MNGEGQTGGWLLGALHRLAADRDARSQFGRISIADAMYFPVRTRLRTYGVAIPDGLLGYVRALDDLPAVRALNELARSAPAVPVYDAYLRELGGDPNAAL